jgi:mannose-6-phosphate isomerase-like protein (cupin superfamily)
MDARIVRPDRASEFMTPERCIILEAWNDPSDAAASIALARVAPGVTTQLHRLNGVAERYLMVEGAGTVRVGDRLSEPVSPGDVVAIPAGMSQQITNTGTDDLLFYCVCTPRFSPECYENLE